MKHSEYETQQKNTTMNTTDNTEKSQNSTTTRIRTKRDNAELALGLSTSFVFFLFGLNTGNIVYTIAAVLLSLLTIKHYEDKDSPAENTGSET